MTTEKDPFFGVRDLMIESLERSRSATQSYVDLVEKKMHSIPGAKESQVGAFKAYIERQVAANHAFVERLLCAKDFPEALHIQTEYFQSQLAATAETPIKSA
jgi:hypothetical protein